MQNNSFYAPYQDDVQQVWKTRLGSEFFKANQLIEKHTGGKLLERPSFKLMDMKTRWGEWNPAERIPSLNMRLFNDFEWGAVVHVLRHEMAHMVVSEIWNLDVSGVSHGEAFKKACDMLEISTCRTCSIEMLANFKGGEEDGVVGKVRKLFAKGHDDAVTEAEAELFLQKAHSLMTKHNISMQDVTGEDRFFIRRPVGSLYKRFPSYITDIARLCKDHYFVQTIRTCVNVHTGNYTETHWYMEFFGERDNLNVAEYVFYALLNHAELAYKVFKADRAKELKELGSNPYRTKISKAAFIGGLVSGYKEVLKEQERIEVKVNPESEALIWTGDPLLGEMYDKAYPRRTRTCGTGKSGLGWGAGKRVGKGLRLGQGVTSGGGGGKYLTT